MNKYDGNQPGVTHAPGVLCYIKCRATVGDLIRALSGKVPSMADNGKIVELVQLYYPGDRYCCRQCGGSAILESRKPLWEVRSKSVLATAIGCDQHIGMFHAEELIPIGAPGLVSDEDTETTKPLEESTAGLADAASGLLSLTIRKVPATNK